MTSVDELFRKPATSSSSPLPTGSKRKFPESAIPSTSTIGTHKSAKRTANGTPYTPTVEDEAANNDAGDDDDIAAGPALPPSDAEDEDEEGGRFFGGGVSADTREALDYVEGLDAAGSGSGEGGQEEEEMIDVAWLRRMAVRFEKGINRNAELRGRFEAEPEKYVYSLFVLCGGQ